MNNKIMAIFLLFLLSFSLLAKENMCPDLKNQAIFKQLKIDIGNGEKGIFGVSFKYKNKWAYISLKSKENSEKLAAGELVQENLDTAGTLSCYYFSYPDAMKNYNESMSMPSKYPIENFALLNGIVIQIYKNKTLWEKIKTKLNSSLIKL